MGLGHVALGLASVVMGVHHLRNGARHLGGSRRGLGLGDAMPSFDTPFPPRAMPAPIANSGRKTVRAPNGSNVSMQMRSFEIRSLDDRIRYLERLVDEGKRDPQVYAFARRALTKKCGRNWCIDEKDNVREAQALFNAVRKQHPAKMSPAELATAKTLFQNIRKNVRYTSDILGVDTYQKPSHTLALHSGDCDDYSTLTCAALLSVGIPCRFVVIRTKGAGDWNHIYPEAGFPRANPTKWVPMDSSVKMPFGWAAPPRMVAAKRTFRIR
jgi:hypothetical protein